MSVLVNLPPLPQNDKELLSWAKRFHQFIYNKLVELNIRGGIPAYNHVRANITDFWNSPFWANIPDKPSTFPPSVHASSHHSGGSDALSFSSIAGFSDYLDQVVKTNSVPTFEGLITNGLKRKSQKYIFFPEQTDNNDFIGVSQLKIGPYLTLGNFGLNNYDFIGTNAILDYSSFGGVGSEGDANKFIPTYAFGKGIVLEMSFLGSWSWYGIDWGGSGARKSFPGDFTHIISFLYNGNVGIRTTDQFGSGVGVIGIANATTVPTTNPTGGGVLYAYNGALYWRGSSGTVTQIAPA